MGGVLFEQRAAVLLGTGPRWCCELPALSPITLPGGQSWADPAPWSYPSACTGPCLPVTSGSQRGTVSPASCLRQEGLDLGLLSIGLSAIPFAPAPLALGTSPLCLRLPGCILVKGTVSPHVLLN